jgi:hypothetical protein
LIILHILRVFEVLGFVSLGFAILLGRNKSLLRLLMLRSLAPWGMMPWDLMPWGLILRSSMELDSMEPNGELDTLKLHSMESNMESDTRPEILCRNLLVWTPLS